MSISDRILELQRLLDDVFPEIDIKNILEEGEWEGLSKTQQDTAEEYFDAAIALIEHKLESRIALLKKRGLSPRGEYPQKLADDVAHRVGVMLHPDLTFILIITSVYSNKVQGLSSPLGRPAIKSTLDVMIRDWEKK